MTLPKPYPPTLIDYEDWNVIVDAIEWQLYSYMIYKEGSDYYAKNGDTGVIDYGGSDDAGGVDGTDAAAVIQAAIDIIDHGRILLKAAVYSLATRLDFTDKRHLIFEGESIGTEKDRQLTPIASDRGTILKLENNKDTNIIYASPSTADLRYLTFRNLYLFGNRANQLAGSAMYINNCKRTRLENIEIWDAWAYGLELIDCETSWLSSIEVAESGAGFNLNSARLVCIGLEAGNTNIAITGDGFGFYIKGVENEFFGLKAGISRGQGIYVDTSEDSSFFGGIVERNQKDGMLLVNCDNILVSGLKVQNNNQVIGGWDGLRLNNSTNCIISLIRAWDDQGVKTQEYGIKEEGTSDYNQIFGNNLRGNKTDALIYVGANTEIFRNLGYVTENGGTDTLTNGTTEVIITHGLAYTPSAEDIDVHPIETLNNASFWWVDTITSTTFKIKVNADPAQDVDFKWSVRRI